PEGDWRNTYFVPENLIPTVEKVDALKKSVPAGMTLPEMALRFILSEPAVATTIPGMRKTTHVTSNMKTSDDGPLSPDLIRELRKHRWDRKPRPWSQ
ncbi:MAG TPA: aldo/keto reductase, partial [Bacteroidales bacterium]|nr:aldo/keto reductase [Bacteroidales bacterium]